LSSPEAIGVDLGGSKLLVGVLGDDHQVLHRSLAVSAGLGPADLLATLEHELRAAIEARPAVAAIGLGVPCTIDRDAGVCINAVNLPISDLPLRDILSQRLGLPVEMDNDANVAALAEHRHGAAVGARNAVMLTIGTGVGGGLILEGELFRGSSGAGAELGHIVVDIDGPPCQGSCPNRGCIETLASGTALVREANEAAAAAPDSALGRLAAAGELTGSAVTAAAHDGDEAALGVFELLGFRLGVALSGIANTFDPDVIVLGGGVMAAGELLLEPARTTLRERALPPQNLVPVLPATLGPDAGMIGAATLAAELAGSPRGL
jgi:glucokinase